MVETSSAILPLKTFPNFSFSITPGSKKSEKTGMPHDHDSIKTFGKPSIGEVEINAFEFAISLIVSE